MPVLPLGQDDDDTTVDEHPGGVRIDEYTDRLPGGDKKLPERTKYRVVIPGYASIPRFDDLDDARLWLSVYYDVGGFQEERTGKFGVPAKVAAAGKDTLAAYLLTQDRMNASELATFFDVERDTIYSYCSRVRKRGRDAQKAAEE